MLAIALLFFGAVFLIKAWEFWVTWIVGPVYLIFGYRFCAEALRRHRSPGSELFRVDVRDGIVTWRHGEHDTLVALPEVQKISLTLNSEASALEFDLPGLHIMLVDGDFTQYRELFEHLGNLYDGPMFENGKPYTRTG